MNYELARKLKDAGFPQGYLDGWDNHGGGKWVQFDGKDTLCHHETGDSEEMYVPTLTELIAACGEGKMYSLVFIDDKRGKWCAHDDHIILEGWGSTPEEAVANLWLTLNDK